MDETGVRLDQSFERFTQFEESHNSYSGAIRHLAVQPVTPPPPPWRFPRAPSARKTQTTSGFLTAHPAAGCRMAVPPLRRRWASGMSLCTYLANLAPRIPESSR